MPILNYYIFCNKKKIRVIFFLMTAYNWLLDDCLLIRL
jgi:hypothetical protein